MNKINKQTKLEQTHRYREQTKAVRDDWRAEGERRGLGEKAEGLSQNKHTHTNNLTDTDNSAAITREKGVEREAEGILIWGGECTTQYTDDVL